MSVDSKSEIKLSVFLAFTDHDTWDQYTKVTLNVLLVLQSISIPKQKSLQNAWPCPLTKFKIRISCVCSAKVVGNQSLLKVQDFWTPPPKRSWLVTVRRRFKHLWDQLKEMCSAAVSPTEDMGFWLITNSVRWMAVFSSLMKMQTWICHLTKPQNEAIYCVDLVWSWACFQRQMKTVLIVLAWSGVSLHWMMFDTININQNQSKSININQHEQKHQSISIN